MLGVVFLVNGLCSEHDNRCHYGDVPSEYKEYNVKTLSKFLLYPIGTIQAPL